ncbi:ribbon-helix-helix domain-containing protein [Crocosphaera sp. UHCC 0190]|uniref:ribbon-helix-helix domain-containing protein n=1 Tax=Crocosphaera sp. UHCC 0190 TaxID=3110246 RepID=UPI002B1FE7E9|nr:ribbon-helix-helix domain-containing protein [Crocosphaera sp. UHCC 0190]MEA5508722.1 ribbon-helix-helix domain-containing protein [Crocosphaera sp. UHCC 0190]
MNFNIYIEDELGEKLQQVCQVTGKKRNAIIREALVSWLSQHQSPTWPKSIQNFEGDKNIIPFESYRSELLPPTEEDLI